MRRHTTTTNVGTYVRLLLLAFLSADLVLFLPYFGAEELESFFSFIAVNIGILYAITIGFLMMIAINRKQALDAAISLELNKLRRLHHLALHIHKATPGTAKWYKAVDKSILEYLKAFGKRDFLDYEQGDKLARAMTYAVYALPQATEDYNDDLYGELLSASASITESRENIRATKDASIGYFQWLVTVGMTVLFAFISAAATPEDVVPRLLSGAVIFNLFLMLQLIYEYDQTNPKKRRVYVEAYLDNARKLS
jgi:hypothetical protein